MGMYNIDLEQLNSKINGNWFRECPVCHGKETIGFESDLMQLTEFKGGNLSNEIAVIPLVVLTCGNCGNTILLNAINLGLVSDDEFTGETQYERKLR